jgi:hypothetical protein
MTTLPDSVTISVERMMRFCYLAEMTFETRRGDHEPKIPVHLTRFGTLAIESASWLYSLFDDRSDSINLQTVWQGFDHPFGKELQEIVDRLAPFKSGMKLVRNRIGFHGSLNRETEREGVDIFDVNSGRGRQFIGIMRDMERLAVRMIDWFCRQNTADGNNDEKMLQEFYRELKNI